MPLRWHQSIRCLKGSMNPTTSDIRKLHAAADPPIVLNQQGQLSDDD